MQAKITLSTQGIPEIVHLFDSPVTVYASILARLEWPEGQHLHVYGGGNDILFLCGKPHGNNPPYLSKASLAHIVLRPCAPPYTLAGRYVNRWTSVLRFRTSLRCACTDSNH